MIFEWLPASTAPRDGTPVLVAYKTGPTAAHRASMWCPDSPYCVRVAKWKPSPNEYGGFWLTATASHYIADPDVTHWGHIPRHPVFSGGGS